MSTPADNSCVFIDGPWEHRFVRANGGQFHLVHMGDHSDVRPLVLLVHGFPEYWWAWRNQIEPLADAGYEVVACDQRGIAGSDKTPNSQDALTLSQDIPAIARSLGAANAVVVGHGRGGQLAWSAPCVDRDIVSGVLTFSAPHTRALQRPGTHLTLRTWRHALTTFVPAIARQGLISENYIRRLLAEWSAPGNDGASAQAALYAAAMRLPEAADTALEQLRWSYSAAPRPSGKRYFNLTKRPISTPVWTVRGQQDPLLPYRAWQQDKVFTTGPYRQLTIPSSGHFIHEEAPEAATDVILEFLASL